MQSMGNSCLWVLIRDRRKEMRTGGDQAFRFDMGESWDKERGSHSHLAEQEAIQQAAKVAPSIHTPRGAVRL